MHLTAVDYFCGYKPVVITVINQNCKDVQSFIESELRSPDRCMKSCIDKEPELEQKFRDALIERAGTMYVLKSFSRYCIF